jgi:hypothetical protein
MKFSKITIETLKNFATINQGILFKAGKELRTMNVMKNIFAVAQIPDEIPNDFAIYDLNEFLPAYSLLNDCDITFKDTMLVLEVPGNSIKYPYSSPSVVVSPGDKKIRLPSEDKKFVLTREVFDAIQKSSSVMKLKDIVSDCSGITILNRNATGNSHHISLNVECGSSDVSENPSLIKVENLKLLPLDYDVTICQKGLTRFTSRSEEFKIEYHIALEIE